MTPTEKVVEAAFKQICNHSRSTQHNAYSETLNDTATVITTSMPLEWIETVSTQLKRAIVSEDMFEEAATMVQSCAVANDKAMTSNLQCAFGSRPTVLEEKIGLTGATRQIRKAAAQTIQLLRRHYMDMLSDSMPTEELGTEEKLHLTANATVAFYRQISEADLQPEVIQDMQNLRFALRLLLRPRLPEDNPARKKRIRDKMIRANIVHMTFMVLGMTLHPDMQ